MIYTHKRVGEFFSLTISDVQVGAIYYLYTVLVLMRTRAHLIITQQIDERKHLSLANS